MGIYLHFRRQTEFLVGQLEGQMIRQAEVIRDTEALKRLSA